MDINKSFKVISEKSLNEILNFILEAGTKYCLNRIDLCLFLTAVSELGTNLVKYAYDGRLEICFIHQDKNSRCLAKATSTDSGPGIKDIDKAMQENFSSGNSLGIGLNSCKRIGDFFEIESSRLGTRVYVMKSLRYE